MRRDPKPAKSKETKPPVARKSLKDDDARVRDLEKRLAEALRDKAEASKREAEALGQLQTRDRELAESREQQAATAEILRVISSSPSDVQPVFEAIVSSAKQLVGAYSTALLRLINGELHLVASSATTPLGDEALRAMYPRPLTQAPLHAQAIRDRAPLLIEDTETDPRFITPLGREIARQRGYRSTLQLPLVHGDRVIGVIAVSHAEPRSFPREELELVKTFADQAVIAIENVRLFTELQEKNTALTQAHAQVSESLEQQTATSEILRVIAGSPTDLQPVFDAILKRAATLCEAQLAHLWLYEGGEQFRLGAGYGSRPDHLQWLQQGLHRIGPPFFRESGPWRVGQVLDVRDTEPYRRGEPLWIRTADHEGMRTLLGVPLVKDGRLVGSIAVYRREVQPFTDQQTALVQTFADQAVIAIENVRLFNETKEALEQQTATSEILRVISQSPTDAQPVFDTIARSAMRLCAASLAVVARYDGELLHLAAHTHVTADGEEAIRQYFPIHPTRSGINGRVVLEARVVRIPDVQADAEYSQSLGHSLRHRSALGVPMLRDGRVVGTVAISRHELRPFTDKEVTLLETFADQAVIAIENVRLFNETKEALDRQTATSEILRVISSSPTDVQPVFNAIVRHAVTLCGALWGMVWRFDGDAVNLVGHHNLPPEELEELHQAFPQHVGEHGVFAMIRTGVVSNLRDVESASEVAASTRARWRRRGVRSAVTVPMRRDNAIVGALGVSHREVGAFSPTRVELLKTFADQAVIAIENVRLFKELEARNRDLSEALDRQTATADVLRIIAQSPTELQPVLNAIASSAVRLCAASDAVIERLEGERFYNAAHAGVQMKGLVGLPLPLTRHFPGGRAILDRRPIIIDDIHVVAASEYPDTLELLKLNTIHSVAEMPLLSEGKPLGSLAVLRSDVRPFTDAEVALLKTFADQAVIAIENVRLFQELQTSNHELTTALEQQTATAEVLRVISSSPTDTQPVFDSIVESAVRLCAGVVGAVFTSDDKRIYLRADFGSRPETRETVRSYYPIPLDRTHIAGRAILDAGVVHVPDIEAPDAAPEGSQAVARMVGYRSALATPMFRDGRPIGVIFVCRRDPGPFSDEQIRLLRTFADQAVIAIENVRLFTELQEKNRELTQAHAQVTEALEQQTATSEILRVISSSPTDVEPVFKTILVNANTLCDASFSVLWLWEGEALIAVAHENVSPKLAQNLRTARPRPHRRNPLGLSVLEQTVVHVADVLADPRFAPEDVPTYRLEGARSILSVPMVREGSLVGVINIWRREPRAFTDAQIALVRTFADQAVIAIENVRLFKELQARTHELTRSVDQLTALGEVGRAVSSTLDLETVLTTIVSRAVQLSGLDGGVVFEYDDNAQEFVQRAATETGGALAESRRATRIRKGEGVLGRTAITLEPIQVPDITVPGAHEGRLRENLIESGIRAVLAVPMVYEGRLIGGLGVTRNRPGEFPVETIELLRTFATQSALAIQNARLFREIEEKSHQLEVASQHKSEFLANMSHELRTPLNAIIGFSEVLSERMFGELNEKQEEYLKDIYASGTHLLSLINDILDLSKIEAGRMELELTDFHLPTALDSALTLVRERAARRGIALQMNVDSRVGQIQADERKVRQVVLNLLSNAIKFTPEGGRIEVGAVPKDGLVEVSVSDTGVGIAPEDQEAIFEEFRQVGTAAKKVEGTGLGLTLCRKFVELHGGRIWATSQVGVGSTFTFTIPVRRGE